MPDVVTHRFHPAVGVCPNICSLPDAEASRVLDDLRRQLRPNLKLNYLVRRRDTENWLLHAASTVLGRRLDQPPGYFFLGDFSHARDLSRPATFQLPVSSLRSDAITFTLGDSMTVVQLQCKKVYTLNEIIGLFAEGDDVAEFGLTDRYGFQKRFIEMQLWDRPLCRHD